MAVPSVVRFLVYGHGVAAPVEGATMGGTLLEVYGDGFRLPTPPPADYTPDPGAAAPRTVEIVFRAPTGEEVTVDDVRVLASNKIRMITPPTPIPVSIDPSDASASVFGEGDVDVIIRNLDDNEDPIPGEELVVADAFTYRRPKLDATSKSDLTRIVETYLVSWMRSVLPNTLRTQHVDFDDNPVDALNTVAVASLPAVVLVGPDMPENRFYSRNADEQVELSDGTVVTSRKAFTVDLFFDVILMSDNAEEMLNLQALAMQFIDRTPWIEIARSASDPSLGTIRFEHDYQPGGFFSSVSRPNNASLEAASASVVIRGFPITDLASFELEGVTDEPTPASELPLDVGPKSE